MTQITEQDLRTRLERLHKERDHTQATLYAYDGAIQECEYWLDLHTKATKDTDNEVSAAS